MKHLSTLAIILATTLTGCGATADPDTTPAPAPEPRGRHAAVNGLQMYYEVHGRGQPLVLLHGAFCTIDACFAKLIPALATGRQVIAVELQGHGHTRDADRPLTYPQLADDVAALLDHLGIAQADVLGYSLGGGVATELALRHPTRVRKLVLSAAALDRGGLHPGILEGVEQITPEVFAGSPWEKAYLDAAPDPAGWPVLIDKVKQLDREFEGWSAAQIRTITAPTLVMIGDSDIVRPEHAVEMFRLFGGGVAGDVVGLPDDQLAILPGTTHVSLIDRADWVGAMVAGFLAK